MFAFDLLITFLGYDNIIIHHPSLTCQVAFFNVEKTVSTTIDFSSYKYKFFFPFILSLFLLSI